MRLPVTVLVILLTNVLHVDLAAALPRFAARTGAKCQSCHVDPSGGAMRQAFGVRYGREQLPVSGWSGDFELEDFSTLLTNFLGVGADFRTIYYYQQRPDSSGGASADRNTLWQMQGDLYLNFKIAKKVGVFLKKGLYSGFEAFGLLNILPAHGHIKVGKFIPNYGTKNDDHTSAIRTYTGLSPERGRPELTGIEVGISPGPVSVTGGFYNSADGFGESSINTKAVLGRAEGMFALSESMHLGLGANVMFNKSIQDNQSDLFGGFGSFSYGDFAVFGEADYIKTHSLGTKITGIAGYVEADYVVTSGLDLKVAYDFYDPDTDVKTGAVSRYSFGFEFFPISGVEVRPMYRIVKEDPVDVRSDEFHLLLHFYL